MAITVSGTSITFNDATVQTTAGKSGTVTSVATGNGLSGGTITTTGTLTVACPTFNTVGSYVSACLQGGNLNAGSNYAASANFTSAAIDTNGIDKTNNLSGTWKWMAANTSAADRVGIACRVS